MTGIGWALLEPAVSVDAWLRLGLPEGLALLLPVLVLALAASLVLAVLMAARRTTRRARLALHVENSGLRSARRVDRPARAPGGKPAGGRGPRAPGMLLAGS